MSEQQTPNKFTVQTNLVISELQTVTQTYDPLQVPQQTLKDITKWVGLVSQAQIERIRECLPS